MNITDQFPLLNHLEPDSVCEVKNFLTPHVSSLTSLTSLMFLTFLTFLTFSPFSLSKITKALAFARASGLAEDFRRPQIIFSWYSAFGYSSKYTLRTPWIHECL